MAGRNTSEHRGGPERHDAKADPTWTGGRLVSEPSDVVLMVELVSQFLGIRPLEAARALFQNTFEMRCI